MDAIDVKAERDQAVARRQADSDAERRRGQARRILSGDNLWQARWNASLSDLQGAIAEKYTKMEPAERRKLLEVALEVQRTERPRIDPSQVHTRVPVRESGAKRRPLAAVTQPNPEPKEDTEVPQKKFTPEQRVEVRRWLQGWRVMNPRAGVAEGLQALEERFGVKLTLTSFRKTYWIKVPPSKGEARVAAAELPAAASRPTPSTTMADRMLSRPDWDEGPSHPAPATEATDAADPVESLEVEAAPAETLGEDVDEQLLKQVERGASTILNGNGAGREALAKYSGPEHPAAPARAASEIVDGERQTRILDEFLSHFHVTVLEPIAEAAEAGARISALETEIRQLRATYEGGEFVRIEEQDGGWALQVGLRLPDRRQASRLAARIHAVLAEEEVAHA